MTTHDRAALAGRSRYAPVPSLRSASRAGVAVCVAVSLVLGAVYSVRAVDRLGDEAARNAGLSYEDREFGGGNSFVVDKRALYEARAHIPSDDTYRVVVGPGVVGATENTVPYIEVYARYFLMPRRPAADSRWVLCYGCDLAELGGGFEVVWENGSGIVLGRLGR